MNYVVGVAAVAVLAGGVYVAKKTGVFEKIQSGFDCTNSKFFGSFCAKLANTKNNIKKSFMEGYHEVADAK